MSKQANRLKEFGGVKQYSLTNQQSQSFPKKPSFGILLFLINLFLINNDENLHDVTNY